MKTLNDASPTEWDVACREASRQGAEVTKELKEPTQLVTGLTHREMLDWMAADGVFCSPDKYARRLMEVQRRALASRNSNEETETSSGED